MSKGQRALRILFFSLWAVVMTSLTYVLGAPSLKVLRRYLGREGYWVVTTLLSAGMYLLQVDVGAENGGVISFKPLAFAFFSLAILIGVFDEFEEMGFSLVAGAFFTILINTLVSAGAFALWVFHTGPKWDQVIVNLLEGQLRQFGPHIQVSYFDLMLQLPSVLIILWLIALYVAVRLENRLSQTELIQPIALPSLRAQLGTLRLPDVCVWIFIASLLGAFVDFHMRAVEAVSVNTMNICLLLFAFQGIAVMAKVFERIRLGPPWQFIFTVLMVVVIVLLMVLLMVPLFLFVSLLGLLDYWLDFRARLSKRTEEFNRET